MQGKWGKAWLAAMIVLVSLTCAPLPGWAAEGLGEGRHALISWRAPRPPWKPRCWAKNLSSPVPLPLTLAPTLLSDLASGLQLDQDGGAALKLPL